MVVDLALLDSSPPAQLLPPTGNVTATARSTTMAALGLTGRAGALLLLAIATSNVHGMAKAASATTIAAKPATTTCDMTLTAGGSCPPTPRPTATIFATEPAQGLFYLDEVVPEASLAQLKARFNLTMRAPFMDGRRMMEVPEGVVVRLETALQHRRLELAVSQGNGTDDDNSNNFNSDLKRLQLPIQEHENEFGNHKDHYHQSNPNDKRVVVEGQVGVLYLDGDGQMIFTNDESKAETSIDIMPGRFIAWANSAFTHRVVHGPRNVMRRMLGPLTWDDASQEETREGGFDQTNGGLLSVCGGTQVYECNDLAGYRCNDATYVSIAGGNSSYPLCGVACENDGTINVGYGQFDSINSVCYCGYSTACSTFTPSNGFIQFRYNGGTCPTLAGAPTGFPSLAPVSTSAPSNTPVTSSPSLAPISTSAPSNAPVTSSPTNAPVTASPSLAPSSSTTAPTQSPSSSPSGTPAVPTSFPTFAPLPPNGTVQALGQRFVCGPEETLVSGRRHAMAVSGIEEEEEEERLKHAGEKVLSDVGRAHHQQQRVLAAPWTPETCFAACAQRLGNPPSFVINIYLNDAGKQVCTCCRFCEGTRFVPSAQTFAACGGVAADLSLMAKASHGKIDVRRGGKIKYTLRLTNSQAFEGGVGLRVVLPPYVTCGKSSTKPRVYSNASAAAGGEGNLLLQKPRKTGASAAANDTLVDWPSVPMPAGQRRKFSVYVRVRKSAPVGTSLVFTSYVYQSTPTGVTFCDAYAEDVTVLVKK